jgi:uncharacterized SAM-binding protein YcdF (DUF218 family)
LSFVLDKLAVALISPLGTALVLALFGLFLGLRAYRRGAFALGLFGALWLAVWSTPVASNWVRLNLENEYPLKAVDQLPEADAIVLLGGALGYPESGARYPNLYETADRVWHAARIYRAGKAPVIVCSGGGDKKLDIAPEALAMREFLRDLGVPEKALLIEGESLNTRENARFTAQILEPLGAKRILLVTSALHMRRAVALFEAQGFQVIPAATDHEAQLRFNWQDWIPNAGSLEGSARGIKEIVARAVGR